WMLAASYAVAGQKEVAKQLVANLSTMVSPYREMSYTYGSHIRDKALILETLLLIDDKTKAFEVLKDVSAALGDQGYWMSTQETGMSLRAIAKFAGAERRGEMKFDYSIGNAKSVSASTAIPISQIEIPIAGSAHQSISVVN